MSQDQNAADAPTLEQRVQQVIQDEIRPAIQMDGGDIVLTKIEGKKVIVELQGAWVGCPHAAMTLKMGVQRRLQQLFPEIEEVISE